MTQEYQLILESFIKGKLSCLEIRDNTPMEFHSGPYGQPLEVIGPRSYGVYFSFVGDRSLNYGEIRQRIEDASETSLVTRVVTEVQSGSTVKYVVELVTSDIEVFFSDIK